MKYFLIFTFLLFLDHSTFAQYTLKSVKYNGNGWISNPDHILKQQDASKINTLLTEVENATTVQIAVVVLNSIGDQVPKDFAHDLFNLWGVGRRDKNNGLLLLVVMNPKRWEFETGYGLEGVLPDATLNQIGMQIMAPQFRAQEFGTGIIKALERVKEILIHEASEQNKYNESGDIPVKSNEVDEASKSLTSSEEGEPKENNLIIYFLIIEGIFAGIVFYTRKRKVQKTDDKAKMYPSDIFYLILVAFTAIGIFNAIFNDSIFKHTNAVPYLILLYMEAFVFAFVHHLIKNKLVKNQDPYQEYKGLEQAHRFLLIFVILFPFAFIPYFIWYKIHKIKVRSRPRVSKSGKTMHRLNENEDDVYLDHGQTTEEKIKSVDYDVWVTDDQNEKKVEAYKSSFSRYQKCVDCGYIAKHLKTDKTLKNATYYSTGIGERVYSCKNCLAESRETYVIPKITRPSSSSGSSGGSRGGGGSFGGGSSGGGGAGGSW